MFLATFIILGCAQKTSLSFAAKARQSLRRLRRVHLARGQTPVVVDDQGNGFPERGGNHVGRRHGLCPLARRLAVLQVPGVPQVPRRRQNDNQAGKPVVQFKVPGRNRPGGASVMLLRPCCSAKIQERAFKHFQWPYYTVK